MEYQLAESTFLYVLSILFVLICAKHEHYYGWKSYHVGASTEDQVKHLNNLGTKLGLDFLSPTHVLREALVLVQPKVQEEFIKNLNDMGIKYSIHADDIKSVLDYDDKIIQEWKKTIARQGGSTMPYNNYQRLNVIYSYMNDIANNFKNITTMVAAGPSFEKRPINYMKISTTNFKNKSKPVIFIDGAIHAREWISPPTVTWAIRKLTEDLTEPELLNNYDWILLPVVNPDGYEFSFNKVRFWRKTRSNNTHVNSTICPGVDANRNFDVDWGDAGASHNPCSEVYAGNHPFCEIESRVVRDILHEYRTRIALYITMHSYGSMILYPWGHTTSYPSDEQSLITVAIAIADAIDKVARPEFPCYVVGSSAHLMYRCSGTAKDYAHKIGIPFTYTLELPGLTESLQGFNLKPMYIQQVCRETWAGVVQGVRKARQLL